LPDLSGVSDGVSWSIPQKIDRPAGLNLHDHPFSVHFITLNATADEIAAANNQISYLLGQVNQYYDTRSGPLSYVGSNSAGFYMNPFDNPVNPNGFPTIEWMNYQFDIKQAEFRTILTEKFTFKPEYAQTILDENQNYKILMVQNELFAVKSRGAVQLRNGDPTSAPKLYKNYITDVDGSDRRTLIGGVNKLLEFINTPAMQAANARLVRFNITECDTLVYPSDDYWSCYFKYFLQNGWHPAGSCKMSKATDPSAVVDPTLKVIGISGVPRVRVADASIMPQITSSNTQCPCYAIGEKAADMIIADNP
jgi:choline dehydrogenase